MSEKKKTVKMDQAIFIGISCLVVGFILGMTSYHLIIGTPEPVRVAQQQPSMGGGMPPPAGMPPPMNAPGSDMPIFSEKTKEIEKFVAQNPKNLNALIELGNAYFDDNRAQESVDAYSRALAIEPKNPNVLTDRGIMYRKLGKFNDAIADFKKSQQIDPNHTQSLYNLGLVYLHDLQDQQNAVAAWEGLLRLNIDPQTRAQMEQRVTALKNMKPEDLKQMGR